MRVPGADVRRVPDAVHRIVAQARAQAFAQCGQGSACCGRVSNRSRAAGTNGGNSRASRRNAAHRRRDRRLLQAGARELEQHRRLALGGEQADRARRVCFAPLVFQPHHETLHAAVAPGQEGGQIVDQPPQREQQRWMVFDLVAEFDAASK